MVADSCSLTNHAEPVSDLVIWSRYNLHEIHIQNPSQDHLLQVLHELSKSTGHIIIHVQPIYTHNTSHKLLVWSFVAGFFEKTGLLFWLLRSSVFKKFILGCQIFNISLFFNPYLDPPLVGILDFYFYNSSRRLYTTIHAEKLNHVWPGKYLLLARYVWMLWFFLLSLTDRYWQFYDMLICSTVWHGYWYGVIPSWLFIYN